MYANTQIHIFNITFLLIFENKRKCYFEWHYQISYLICVDHLLDDNYYNNHFINDFR